MPDIVGTGAEFRVTWDIDAVRRANSEDPRRKISNGKPAVRPAAAT